MVTKIPQLHRVVWEGHSVYYRIACAKRGHHAVLTLSGHHCGGLWTLAGILTSMASGQPHWSLHWHTRVSELSNQTPSIFLIRESPLHQFFLWATWKTNKNKRVRVPYGYNPKTIGAFCWHLNHRQAAKKYVLRKWSQGVFSGTSVLEVGSNSGTLKRCFSICP